MEQKPRAADEAEHKPTKGPDQPGMKEQKEAAERALENQSPGEPAGGE
jgi:hypothetical protein